jgi:aminoglycoside phosphotransferase (APT) family kinase protein
VETVTVNTVMNTDAPSTTDAVLATLRQATDRPALTFAGAPVPLTGGFYAEMLRFRLDGAPSPLDRELVARIVPEEPVAAWEAAIQRAVADQGFPTPAVRLVVDGAGPLGRPLVVMDAVDGRPPLAGLTFGSIVTQLPTLLRSLPDQLADLAARLHALDAGPLADELVALDTGMALTTADFVRQQVEHSRAVDRLDLVAAGERLLATEPPTPALAIAHGDLHPFNVLETTAGPVLVDWTVARVAHPGFTVGFTHLVLGHPPITLPLVGAAPMRPIGRHLARRFLEGYRRRTDGTPAEVDDRALAWFRGVHALRILVELAGWDVMGTRPTSGHPWLSLEPIARRELDIYI